MKITDKILAEKAVTYGFKSFTEQELYNAVGYKGTDYFESQHYFASKELIRRKETIEIKKIVKSTDSYNIMNHLETCDHEQFWAIYLKRNHDVIKDQMLFKGGVSTTLVDIKVIFKHAFLLNASAIVLCHNHPSGNLKPSEADFTITKSIKKVANLMDVSIIDHVIIGNNDCEGKYYSFNDNGDLHG
jgi:DNA repair protein RadC